MTITNDAFGNYYVGNYITGDVLNWTEVLSCLRQALGSNDRANMAAPRLDWRPNIAEETLTGVVGVPTTPYITSESTLATNSRFASSYYPNIGYKESVLGASGSINTVTLDLSLPAYTGLSKIHICANNRSFAYFLELSSNVFYFMSEGVLLNNTLGYPNNIYHLGISTNTLAPSAGNTKIVSASRAGGLLTTIQTFGTITNYSHTKLSDSNNTTSEVELYLRSSTGVPYGYVPNVFKWKVDGVETVPTIGQVVKLNFANASNQYAGQGNVFCKVVGRLGNASVTDLTGDYLMMRISDQVV